MTARENEMSEELFRQFESRVVEAVSALERTRSERDADRAEAGRLREALAEERAAGDAATQEIRAVLSSAIRMLREE